MRGWGVCGAAEAGGEFSGPLSFAKGSIGGSSACEGGEVKLEGFTRSTASAKRLATEMR